MLFPRASSSSERVRNSLFALFASQIIITDGNAQIAIYGIDGKMLLSGMGNTLSVAGLDGGIYIATINNGKTTEKIKFRK